MRHSSSVGGGTRECDAHARAAALLGIADLDLGAMALRDLVHDRETEPAAFRRAVVLQAGEARRALARVLDVLLTSRRTRAREIELRDEPGDRRAQLVRRVRDEARLAVLRGRDAREHAVELLHHRLELVDDGPLVDGAQ